MFVIWQCLVFIETRVMCIFFTAWKLPVVLKKYFAALMFLAWFVGAHADGNLVSTISLNAWDFKNSQISPEKLQKLGFNHVTLYIQWSDVESEKGIFRFDEFDQWMEPLVKGGIKFILVLDFGGTKYIDDNGVETNRIVIPEWFQVKYLDAAMLDFSKKRTKQINFRNREALRLTSRFIDQSVRHFSEAYGSAVTGYAIGLQDEREIKYGQEGYEWRDYGREFSDAFKARFGDVPPVINYNNEVAQGRTRREPLLFDLLKSRDADLKAAVCHYADIIRGHRQSVVGYFGEIFTSHDAIYGGGVVQELAPCIDIAVADFNFYDGYELKNDPNVLPLMANYLVHNGFKKILIGAYGERWANQGKGAALFPYVRQSVERALSRNQQVIGYEIAGFYGVSKENRIQPVDLHALAQLKIDNGIKKASPGSRRIGLFASRTNFDFWHGERSNQRNIHQDALIEAYALLSEIPDAEVIVLGERALREDTELVASLDAIFVPHQIVLPREIKQRLRNFWASGGVLVQDMRLGEFSADGDTTSDWLHDVFGIQDVRWSGQAGRFAYGGKVIDLDMQGKTYVNHGLLKARSGYAVAATYQGPKEWMARIKSWISGKVRSGQGDAGYGLILRGDRSLVFGCLPQIVEGESAPIWRRIFMKEITDAVAQRSRSMQPSSRPSPYSAPVKVTGALIGA